MSVDSIVKTEHQTNKVSTNLRRTAFLPWALILLPLVGAQRAAAIDPWLDFAVGVGNPSPSDSDVGRSIALDSAGNVYVTGLFGGTADFDPGPGVTNLTSVGDSDVFVMKLDSTGSLLWARSMGGTDSDHPFGIAVDAAGNVYTTGVFQETVDFDPGAGTFNLTGGGLADIFVQKLDSAGNFVWARGMGGTLSEGGLGIAIDASGNVYVAGLFEDTVDFDPGAGTASMTSAGGQDIFIFSLDSSGSLVWAKAMGGTLDDSAWAITLDSSSNVYTSGMFEDTVDFDPGAGTANLVAAGGTDIFVQKMNSAGDFVWARAMSGTFDEQGLGLAVDGSGNVLTTGFFSGTVDFDPGLGTFNLTAANPGFNWDIFVHKLDAAGSFVWARSMGDATPGEGRGIAADAAGNVYTTGFYTFPLDFDPGPGVFTLPGDTSPNIFVQKLNPEGDFVWAVAMGGSFTQDVGRDIAVDAAGTPYLTGDFSGTGDFDPGPGTFNLTSTGGLDVLMAKLVEPTLLPASTNVALLILICLLAMASVLGVYRGTRRATLRRGTDRGR